MVKNASLRRGAMDDATDTAAGRMVYATVGEVEVVGHATDAVAEVPDHATDAVAGVMGNAGDAVAEVPGHATDTVAKVPGHATGVTPPYALRRAGLFIRARPTALGNGHARAKNKNPYGILPISSVGKALP